MLMDAIELKEFLLTAGRFLDAALLTIVIEVPVILLGKVTKNVKLIVLVNLVTNLTLNCVGFILYNLGLIHESLGTHSEVLTNVWVAVAEVLLIPLSEAWTYKKVSEVAAKRIYLITYLANACSFLAGLIFL